MEAVGFVLFSNNNYVSNVELGGFAVFVLECAVPFASVSVEDLKQFFLLEEKWEDGFGVI